MLMKLLQYLIALALLTPTLSANDERRAVVVAADAVAIPATSPIVLGGQLHEEVRENGPPARGFRPARPVVDFLQRDPNEGAAPTHRTEARIAYDEGALYVAVRALDSEPDKIV